MQREGSQTSRPQKLCDIRYEQGERRRADFLAALNSGAAIDQAIAAAGWSGQATYRQNRRRHPWWACQVDYTTSTALSGREPWRPSIGGPESKWPFLRHL